MQAWPALPYPQWKDTFETLRLWTQIVGKVRLAQSPWVNHQWHVTLYVTARGLTTSPVPYGSRIFDVELDFVDHRLSVRADDGRNRDLPLKAQPVRDFHAQFMAMLEELDLPV